MLSRLFKKKLTQEEAQSLLAEGARQGNLKKIDTALQAGADIDHRYGRAELEGHATILAFVVSQSKHALAKELLERGAKHLSDELSAQRAKEEAQKLLLEGARSSDLAKIDRALEAGADINHVYNRSERRDSMGKVIWDSKGNKIYDNEDLWHATILSIVLHHPYHLDQSNEERESKQALAVELLKRCANPLTVVVDDHRPTTPLVMAAILGMDKFIDETAARYSLKDLPKDHKNPLFRLTAAARKASAIKGMQALVAAGEDINACINGETILYRILKRPGDHPDNLPYYKSYIHALFDAGADIHEGDALLDKTNPVSQALVKEHLDTLREQLVCAQSAGIAPQRLIQNGKPTPELLNYCGAHMLPELFTEHRWKGKGGEGLALFETIKAAIPDYYKPMLQAIDLTPLRREAAQKDNGPAVARYVRSRPATPEAER